MVKTTEIHLGDEVRDTITGFTGVVVAITTWLNGCHRVTIQPATLKKNGQPHDTYTMDSAQLEVVKSVKAEPKPSGGDRSQPKDMPTVG